MYNADTLKRDVRIAKLQEYFLAYKMMTTQAQKPTKKNGSQPEGFMNELNEHKICDAIKQNESEVKNFCFLFFGIQFCENPMGIGHLYPEKYHF